MEYAPGEHYAKYGRKCYEKNKEKWQPVRRRYAAKYRQQAVKNTQAYVQRNRRKVADYNKRFGQTVDGKYRLLKHRHKKRGWTDEFMPLDVYAVLHSLPCIYCGSPTNGGIDRLDNNLGYSISNSAPCCELCNHMKWKLTQRDFFSQISKIYNKI